MSTELLNLKSNGVIFHSFGAATAKGRSPYVFKRTVRVAKSRCEDDRDEAAYFKFSLETDDYVYLIIDLN